MSAQLTVEQEVQAPPEEVFSFFTSTDRWLMWQGTEAEIDARPGGIFRVNVRGDGFASGTFVEVDPPRRLVFTWGWEQSPYPVPPGSSTVEITLKATATGTLLTLTQSGLPDEAMIGLHEEGWRIMLPHLASIVEAPTVGDGMKRGPTE